MSEQNHLPPFRFGKHVVELSIQHATIREVVWSIRVDKTWLGTIQGTPGEPTADVVRRAKHWIVQNLPKTGI
jgi:hypothetical protein